jgi:hypothetical protein
VFQVTVIEFVPVPAVIAPPADTAQVYPVIPAVVEYTLPAEFTHAAAGPEITGTGKALTVTVIDVRVLLLQFVVVFLASA